MKARFVVSREKAKLAGSARLAAEPTPHLVFYVECPDHIDVWRMLHGRRDIPAWMHDPDGSD